jgi:hypothetical protein
MKYLILIHSNPSFREMWDQLSDAERMDIGRAHMALTDELATSGELVVSEGLADPSLAKSVSVRDGQVIASDGPYAEVKEHVVGFYLVECESMDRAIEIAGKTPDAAHGEVEVRPVLDLSVLEL